MNMYVSNLGFHVSDEDLKKLFASYGDVTSAKVIMDKVSGKSRGFGFVEMQNETEAQKAMQELEGFEVEGRTISVSVARPKSDSSGGRSFSGGSRGSSRW
jgi:RNA recognition motif-containing protein